MIPAIIIGAVVVLIILICVISKKDTDKKAVLWKSVDSHLKAQSFNPTSKIYVPQTYQNLNKEIKVPSMIISVDMVEKRFAFTKLNAEGFITELLDFNRIKGGEVLIGKTKNSTITSGSVGTFGSVGAGLAGSETTTMVYSMEYRFILTDITNPFYTITIFKGGLEKGGDSYRYFSEITSKLDVLVKSIIENTNI